jgi:hypothetical protein
MAIMETMHAAGRRKLPPVPRPRPERAVAPEVPADDVDPDGPVTDRLELDFAEEQPSDGGPATERFQVALSPDQDDRPAAEVADAPGAPEPGASDAAAPGPESPGPEAPESASPEQEAPERASPEQEAPERASPEQEAPEQEAPEPDASQEFVARLRSAAAEFAEAAGAASAVVREAVPPARHRRARCRVVLRYADESVSDVTFLGPAGAPATRSRHGFDRQIRRWLGSGQHREDAWVVADPEASDGVAVDVTAWLSAS